MSVRLPFLPSRVPYGHHQDLFRWTPVDMEQNRGQKQANVVVEGEQAEIMSARRDPDPSTQPDPFADLIDLSFVDMLKPVAPAPPLVAPPEPTSAPAPVRRDQTYPQDFSSRTQKAVTSPGREAGVITVDPLSTIESTLEAQKRKSQESRQKRDQFLDQMSSFLEGIESSTSSSVVDLIPLDPPASNREVRVPSKPPQTQARAAEVDRVSGMEEVLWRTGTEEGATMEATERIFPGPIIGDSFASSPITTVQPTSSLMLEDGQAEDPFARRMFPSRQQAKPAGVMRGVIIEDDKPHPRGSLFDDDIDDIPPEKDGGVEGVESGTQQPEKEGSFGLGDSVGPPPRRVTTSPASLSVPTYSKGRSVSQPRQGGKGKPTRGLDLEEVRRRTSLLSGGGELSAPLPARTVTPARSAAPRLPEASPFYDVDWRRLDAARSPAPSSGEGPPHPLHASQANDNPLLSAAVSGGTFDERGNYFNEELLRVRGQAGAVSSSGSTPQEDGIRGQGFRKGDALMDSAGNFFSSARDGAKTFLRDAKAGVDAVGNSWQKSRRENGRDHERNGASPPLTRRVYEGAGKSGRDDEREVEFEATFGEGRLGFTLYREQGNGPRKGKGVVCRVHPGSTAHTLGVQLGDAVSGINKRRYETYDEIMEVLPKLPRPVLISFTRGATREGGAALAAAAAAAQQSSTPPSADQQQQGGGNPLEWLANLNPFDRQRRETQEELRGERRNSADASQDGQVSSQPWFPGEVFAQGVRGGVFSWSYYGTSDGVEANSRDTYTEHVMRCQWGRTVDSMQSWMVARRYREFDALDSDLRYAYPDRKDSLPRLPPKEFFKMAPDVVERRTRGLEMYMTTIIRRFPDMLESSQLDRFLTISERISSMRNPSAMVSSSPSVMQRKLGIHGSSSNVFAMAEPSLSKDASAGAGSSALVGTDYILDPMTSEKAYWVSRERKSNPVDVQVAENVIHELEEHLSHLSPTAHLLSDAKLYELMERCQECWPRIKAAAAAALSAGNTETLLPRILQCDERMERAFERLRAALASHGYL